MEIDPSSIGDNIVGSKVSVVKDWWENNDSYNMIQCQTLKTISPDIVPGRRRTSSVDLGEMNEGMDMSIVWS